MPKNDLTYYFSTGSRYSFLSMSQIPQIERRYGVQFDWVPVNGKRIRALRGADPFQGAPQSGQYNWDYRERDAKAWAEYYGITFNEPEDVEFDVSCSCGRYLPRRNKVTFDLMRGHWHRRSLPIKPGRWTKMSLIGWRMIVAWI